LVHTPGKEKRKKRKKSPAWEKPKKGFSGKKEGKSPKFA
jgi:hypothetical protein